MKYREMRISDYNAVIALWKEIDGLKLRDADSFSGIEKYLLRNPGLSFIALKDENIIGSIMSGHDGKRGYIQHLAVNKKQRKLGVATKLLTKCIEALKEEGILKSHINILKDNEKGKNYWASRGWIKRDDIELYSFINASSQST